MPTRTTTFKLFSGLAILFIFAFLSQPALGQLSNHMILLKNNYKNKINFLPGDPIIYIKNGTTWVEEASIQGIGADFIIVSGKELPISKIDYVFRRRTGFNFRGSGKALMYAAPGYLVLGSVNALFAGTSLIPTVTNLIVSGSLLAIGAILPSFQVRKYPIGKKYKLAIVQSDPMLLKYPEKK